MSASTTRVSIEKSITLTEDQIAEVVALWAKNNLGGFDDVSADDATWSISPGYSDRMGYHSKATASITLKVKSVIKG